MPETPYNAQTYLTTPTCTATSARESVALRARNVPWQRSARESAAQSARIAQWQRSAREWGIFSRLEWKIVAACAEKRCPICPKSSVATFCAGIRCQISPDCSVAPFCAGMGYLFRLEWKIVAACAEKRCPISPKCSVAPKNSIATKQKTQLKSWVFVRAKGLEPPRLSALDPKSSAATNYATPAGPYWDCKGSDIFYKCKF